MNLFHIDFKDNQTHFLIIIPYLWTDCNLCVVFWWLFSLQTLHTSVVCVLSVQEIPNQFHITVVVLFLELELSEGKAWRRHETSVIRVWGNPWICPWIVYL